MIREKLKGFVAGFLICGILGFSVVGFAEDVLQTIQVKFNSINLKVNGKAIQADNILYNGVTYVPLRAVSTVLDKNVGWNGDTNTASINDKDYVETNTTQENQNKQSSDFVFRKVKFGMTKQQVINAEGKDPKVDLNNGFVFYEANIDNNTADILYVINSKNQLCSIMITYTQTHTNMNNYIDAYNSYKSMLTNKYGIPDKDDYVWLNDLYKDSPKDYGFAVSLGHLKYMSVWNLSDYKIYDFLNGDNYKCNFNIVYNSNIYEIPKNDSGI